jgi:hypothetical protein
LVRAIAVLPSETAKVTESDASVETVAPPEVRRGDVAFWVLQEACALQADAPSGTVQPDAVSVPVAGVLGVGTAVPPSPPPPHAVSTRARAKTPRMVAKRPGLMFMNLFMILFLSAVVTAFGLMKYTNELPQRESILYTLLRESVENAGTHVGNLLQIILFFSIFVKRCFEKMIIRAVVDFVFLVDMFL